MPDSGVAIPFHECLKLIRREILIVADMLGRIDPVPGTPFDMPELTRQLVLAALIPIIRECYGLTEFPPDIGADNAQRIEVWERRQFEPVQDAITAILRRDSGNGG